MTAARLTIDDFLSDRDLEDKKLAVAQKTRRIQEHFQQNRLFPWTADIIELNRVFHQVLLKADNVLEALPRRIKTLTPDLEVRREPTEEVLDHYSVHADELENVLIDIEMFLREGAYDTPSIRELRDEAVQAWEFFDEHIEVEEDHLGRWYRDGFFVLVPTTHTYHIYRYRYERVRGRILRSSLVGTEDRAEDIDKRELIANMEERLSPPELPLFWMRAQVEMPLQETMLPLGRRRIMRIVEEKEADVSPL